MPVCFVVFIIIFLYVVRDDSEKRKDEENREPLKISGFFICVSNLYTCLSTILHDLHLCSIHNLQTQLAFKSVIAHHHHLHHHYTILQLYRVFNCLLSISVRGM